MTNFYLCCKDTVACIIRGVGVADSHLHPHLLVVLHVAVLIHCHGGALLCPLHPQFNPSCEVLTLWSSQGVFAQAICIKNADAPPLGSTTGPINAVSTNQCHSPLGSATLLPVQPCETAARTTINSRIQPPVPEQPETLDSVIGRGVGCLLPVEARVVEGEVWVAQLEVETPVWLSVVLNLDSHGSVIVFLVFKFL